MVMFDSLASNFLPIYGNSWVKAPNFERLSKHSVTFDKCFVGSMPCMPARRELHTGRYNFLHRSWGPLEPFDNSAPEILKKNGIYTHLISDHYHYWEDGGATYHNRYSSWECIRGQEGDCWKADVADPVMPEKYLGAVNRQDFVNRQYMQREEDTTMARTFKLGLEFLEKNSSEDNWFLQLECFDPHPPYFVPERFQQLYEDGYDGPFFDWPQYREVNEQESPEAIAHVRKLYAAMISMCDYYLGKVLDYMDEHNMWQDTMLILTTDHGFLLGEHNWWAFCCPPFYDQVSVKPLLVWDPRCSREDERCSQLVQTHDIPATLLEFFGTERPREMLGVPLKDTIASDSKAHDYCLFGVFGGHVNISDGRYVYMRATVNPENQPLHNYTLMPVYMRRFFPIDELKTAKMHEPFDFTKGLPVMQTEGSAFLQQSYRYGNLLFDLETDPEQQNPITDPEVEERMLVNLVRLMKENDAPAEQFVRLGLEDRI